MREIQENNRQACRKNSTPEEMQSEAAYGSWLRVFQLGMVVRESNHTDILRLGAERHRD